MKKDYRLKNSDEIELVMKKGFSKANHTFIVYKFKNPNLKKYRVAISAPKKLGKAVVRNKVKRQIRAILQQNNELLTEGYDYFIIARPNILTIDFQTASKQMIHVLKKTELSKKIEPRALSSNAKRSR